MENPWWKLKRQLLGRRKASKKFNEFVVSATVGQNLGLEQCPDQPSLFPRSWVDGDRQPAPIDANSDSPNATEKRTKTWLKEHVVKQDSTLKLTEPDASWVTVQLDLRA